MTTTDDTRYNGWTNYETWNTNLWIDNDEGSHDEARRIVAEHVTDDTPGDYEDTPELDRSVRIRNAADAIEEWWTDTNDPGEIGRPPFPGPVQDAWTTALGRTNWYEIAEGIAEDMTTPAQDRAAEIVTA